MKKVIKSLISLIMAIVVAVGVMTPVAPVISAFKFSNFYTNSDIWLVDCNTHKTSSTLYLYGKADYFCLKLKQTDEYRDIFCFNLYSDVGHTEKIKSYSTEYSEVGTKYINISMSFDDLKSGTYYAETYVYKRCKHGPTGVQLPNSYVPRETDKATRRTYKIKINKKGTDIDEMNTVMYGFENTEKGPKISWYSVPGATGYYLYRKNPSTGKYTKIKTIKDNGKKYVSYVDGTYKDKNATRYYKVVAYKGSKKTPLSLKSLKVKVLKTPETTISAREDNYIKVSWTKVASGAKYTLFMRTKTSDWSKVATTESRSRSVYLGNYENNQVLYFTVVAEVDGVKSGYSVKGKGFKYIEAPEMAACTFSENGGVTVNWNTVEGSDQYTVYKKVDNKWNKIAVVDGSQSSYTDTQSNCYDYNTYTVRSMSKGALKSYSSTGKSGIKFEEVVLNEVVENDGELQISWTNPVENQICNYKVYVKNGEEWKYCGKVSDNQYSYYIKENVLEYQFNVRGTRGSLNGPLNKEGVSYTYYPQMPTPTVTADETGATISWCKLSGIENYVLYKKTTDGEYEIVCETTENCFLDTDIENDVSYSYKLAYKYNGEIITEKESKEITRVFIDEKVSLVDEVYEPTNYRYNIKIENYEKENCSYKLYRRVNNKWEAVSDSVFYANEGKISIPMFAGTQEFAILKNYSDGRVTRLPINGFIVDFNGSSSEVEFSADKNIVTFSWEPEMFDADKVIFYKNNEFLGEAMRSDGKFIDENVQANTNNQYRICTQYNNFVAYKYFVKDYVYLETPNFKVTNCKGYVSISWSQIDVYCDVVIYRAKANSSEYTEIGCCSSNWHTYSDYRVKSGSTYKYTIALRDENGNTTPYNTESKQIKYLDNPVISYAKSYKNGVRIIWDTVGKAQGYVLSYKKDGEWHVLADLPADTTSFIDKTLKSGEKRKYKLYAYSGDYKSSDSEKTVYYVERPAIKSISSTTKQIKINFNAVEGATKYKIYYKNSDDKWFLLGTTTKTSYTHKTQSPGVKFTYAVAGVLENGGKEYSSYKSPGKTAKNLATPILDTISSAKTGIKLTWGIVSSATGYNVYRKNSDGNFEKIAYVKGNESVSYIDKTAKKGKTYTYTVRATYGSAVSSCNKTGLTCKDKY